MVEPSALYVKRFPCLYDKSESSFQNKSQVNAWSKVAEETDFPSEDAARDAFTTLRTKYV